MLFKNKVFAPYLKKNACILTPVPLAAPVLSGLNISSTYMYFYHQVLLTSCVLFTGVTITVNGEV